MKINPKTEKILIVISLVLILLVIFSKSIGLFSALDTQTECTPNWQCSNYGECQGDPSVRYSTCTDLNDCWTPESSYIRTQQCTAQTCAQQGGKLISSFEECNGLDVRSLDSSTTGGCCIGETEIQVDASQIVTTINGFEIKLWMILAFIGVVLFILLGGRR